MEQTGTDRNRQEQTGTDKNRHDCISDTENYCIIINCIIKKIISHIGNPEVKENPSEKSRLAKKTSS